MDDLNLTNYFNRKSLEYDIKQTLREMEKNKTSKTATKGIYLYGNTGIGKTHFVLNILKKMNYDIIYYDSGDVRNKNLIETFSNNYANDTNVYSLLTKKKQKRIIVMDEIDGMNSGDKMGLAALINLLRPKKTKKQEKDDSTNINVFCIGGPHNDKKIRELMNVCNVFEMKSPKKEQIVNVLCDTVKTFTRDDATMLANHINCDIRKLCGLIQLYIWNPALFKGDLQTLYHDTIIEKNIMQTILYLMKEKMHTCTFSENIMENDRTTLALILHENLPMLVKGDINAYKKCLQFITFGDYIDRVIFQNQIWNLGECAAMLKIMPALDEITETETAEKDLVFTKVLTKYSNEYNNQLFLQGICNKLMMDKRDLIAFMYEQRMSKKMSELYEELKIHDVSKLDVDRLYRFIDKLL
jgi:hypothetical protein